MGTQFGYIDIEHEELEKYFVAVKKKIGICDILPRARFSLRNNGFPTYDGLVCSEKMTGRQTGIGAEWCKNCVLEKKNV